ncbi:MAG: BamA/OMP85 family outer membrane protein [Planctomycetota bacterium]
MERAAQLALLVLVECLVVALLAGSAGAQDGQPIVEVQLAGEVGVDYDLLRANLRTRPGAPFGQGLLDEDVRWLADTHGILAEISVEPGPIVRFLLSRIRRYEQVGVEGNTAHDEAELLGVANLRADGEATPDELAAGRDLIRDHYLRLGWAFVQVGVRSTVDDAGRRIALIRVYEGPRVETLDVRIEGLTALRAEDALAVMRSPRGFWSWLVGKDFVRAEVDGDVVLLENFVRGEGFLDGRVALKALEWSEDRSEVAITMLVEEGPRYYVRSLSLQGQSAITEELLRAACVLQEGSPWRRPDIVRSLRAMQTLYGREGYLEAEIVPQELFDEVDPLVDVVFEVREGPQKRVRDVIVRGHAGTRDDVIRRSLTLAPGDIANQEELRWSEDELLALDYFSDFSGAPRVRVDTQPAPDPSQVDVVVDVDDAQSGLFTFIVGAGSDSGLFGGASVNKKNFDLTRTPSNWTNAFQEFFGSGEAFHGGGQRLFFEVMPGTETTDIDIRFEDPWLDSADTEPWGLTVELYDRRRIFEHYDRDSFGTGVSFARRLSRQSSVSWGLRLEDIDIGSVDAAQVPTIALSTGTTRSQALELGYGYQNLDSNYEPTRGFSGSLRLESAGNGLGGDTDLLRLTAAGEWFVPVAEDDDGRPIVLHPRVAFGRVEPTGGAKTLPFFENFFVGGNSGPFGLRGFDFQGVGPHESGDAIGGLLATVASVEALFPLLTRYNPFRDEEDTLLKGVLFLDIGNLVPNGSLGDVGQDLRYGAGAGLRMRLPALGGITLALDVALVTGDEPGDETRSVSFEFARRF